MFDKTLDAAIGKNEILSGHFEQTYKQLEKAKVELVEESIGQIGAAGEQERKRLIEIVDSQIALIREKIDTTRESAEEMVQLENLPPVMTNMLDVLADNPDGLTAREVRLKIPHSFLSTFTSSTINRRLRELANLGYVRADGNRYFSNSYFARQ